MGLSCSRTGLVPILLVGLLLCPGCGEDNGLPPGDITPPSITVDPGVREITASAAAIRWTTDELSSSTVFWTADSTAGWQEASDAALVFEHAVAIAGLSPETEYLFTVQSADAAGNASDPTEPAAFETFSILPTLVVDPWEATVAVGDTLLLAIRVLNVADLFGISFDISSIGNGALFDGDAFSAGPFLGQNVQALSLYDTDTDVLEVAITRLSPSQGVDGDGTLAWLELAAEQPGLSVVDFREGSIALRDPSGALIADFDQLVVVESSITVQ
ncbi:MAG: hypothetical protein KAW17_01745 [Candidatus Eisenbacteria sp.]|nr:hypothetical protein [Candidatus Eisenbacteria bacterium]